MGEYDHVLGRIEIADPEEGPDTSPRRRWWPMLVTTVVIMAGLAGGLAWVNRRAPMTKAEPLHGHVSAPLDGRVAATDSTAVANYRGTMATLATSVSGPAPGFCPPGMMCAVTSNGGTYWTTVYSPEIRQAGFIGCRDGRLVISGIEFGGVIGVEGGGDVELTRNYFSGPSLFSVSIRGRCGGLTKYDKD